MPHTLASLLVVGAGGAIGAAARYLLAGPVADWVHADAAATRFPWGVLAVNLLGCLAIGLLAGALIDRSSDDRLRLLLITGVLGSFTTFSAFGFDTLELLRAGAIWTAAGYVTASVLLGVALAAGGWYITQGAPTA